VNHTQEPSIPELTSSSHAKKCVEAWPLIAEAMTEAYQQLVDHVNPSCNNSDCPDCWAMSLIDQAMEKVAGNPRWFYDGDDNEKQSHHPLYMVLRIRKKPTRHKTLKIAQCEAQRLADKEGDVFCVFKDEGVALPKGENE